MTAFFSTHSTHKATLALIMALAGLFVGLSMIQTQAAANDSSIALKKDSATGLFTLTIKDPDGIQEFSMTPRGKLPYGGGLNGCPKIFVITNTNFDASSDFEPAMPAYVIDCQNNTANLEIAAPKDGFAKSASLVKEEVPPPPAPALREESKKEKKGGPLSASDIVYPVKELGGCQNETECRSYCDNSARAKECFAFAKKYNLITEQEAAEAAEKFLSVTNGPGGCTSGPSCEAYCSSVDHLDACIAFAEKTGYYSGEKLAEAKKFQTLVKAGAQFPGGCKDRNTCELYCNDARHMEECLNFAEQSGFMPKEEIEQARKILPLMQRGETPGGCTSKEQCEAYCFKDAHAEECIAFGEKVGLISSEDAALIKKTGGKGPGGCRSKEQCESYCEVNGDACFQWAQENGLFTEVDAAKMKKGLSRFKEQLDKIPPEVTGCLKDAVGEKNFNKLVNGELVFDRGLEGKMKACFSELTAQASQQFNALPPEGAQCIKDAIGEEGLRKLQSGEFDEDLDFSSLEGCFQKLQSSFGGGPGGSGGPGGFAGPGGCKSIDECTAYCQAHPDECQQFAPPGGGGFPGGGHGGFPGGPGGCKSMEECTAYCKDNPEECKNFMPPGGGSGFPGGGATGGQFPGGGATGGSFPGGCTSQEECQTYCKSNPKECQGFTLPGSGTPGGFPGGFQPPPGGFPTPPPGGSQGGGPGGCTNREECIAYCTDHYTDPACENYIFRACPEDIKQCPNGGSVGRAGPNCEFAACPILPSPSQSCVPPPSGLVSWWRAEGNAADSINGNTGTVSDGVTFSIGKVGTAFKFDRGSVAIGNPANLNFGTGPFSLEAWFNWSGGSSVHNIIRKSNYPASGPGSGYWLRAGNGMLEFSVGETTKTEGQTIITAPVSSGVWHHVVGVKDDSGNIKLYVDGESGGTVLRQALNTQSTSDDPFTLGSWRGSTEFFSGSIDEISVYRRPLSASEVMSLFTAGSAGKCARSSSVDYSGPGGCKTPEECTTYCTKNYQDPACQQFGPGSQADPLNQGFFARVLSAFVPILGIR